MLFENARTSTKQGDIGEARAIYEYTRLGWVVCKPLCDSAKYDLIVEKEGTLKRVQVKTSRFTTDGIIYSVTLATGGGNRSFNTFRPRMDGDYDELFILTSDNRCWMIPSENLGQTSINVGSFGFSEYEVLDSGTRGYTLTHKKERSLCKLEDCSNETDRIYCSQECYSLDRQTNNWSKEGIESILEKYGGNMVKAASYFGVSDNALRKKCKKFNIDFKKFKTPIHAH